MKLPYLRMKEIKLFAIKSIFEVLLLSISIDMVFQVHLIIIFAVGIKGIPLFSYSITLF